MDDPVVGGETVNVPDGDTTPQDGAVSGEPMISETDQWRQAFAAGRRKAEKRLQEQQAELLDRLGVSSFDDLAGLVEDTRISSEEPKKKGQDEDFAKRIQELKAERERFRRKAVEYDKLREQHSQLEKSAIAADVKSRLLAMGAHSEGIGDLVNVLMPNLRWSEDRSDISVVFRDDDGEMIPSPQTLDEWLGEQKVRRPYFFRSSGVKGAGSAGAAAPITQTQDSLKARLARKNAGRQ